MFSFTELSHLLLVPRFQYPFHNVHKICLTHNLALLQPAK